jgi:hypothetical protein
MRYPIATTLSSGDDNLVDSYFLEIVMAPDEQVVVVGVAHVLPTEAYQARVYHIAKIIS